MNSNSFRVRFSKAYAIDLSNNLADADGSVDRSTEPDMTNTNTTEASSSAIQSLQLQLVLQSLLWDYIHE